ncbi:hypothetical protein A628_04500 [Salmonella enterica subsp. enterica serovar Cubana str. 76814]|uniref:Uncharacterized protein n=1 Tax=Salmonella enterica subsp. enterica serovar Cubana str. 76814 TaxID=1192560 RepID=V7IJQ7_SALET|nr:hypothetical protein A628_04500 [Salmonella enterica subsp. enterica serovar Cubana str. 76814]
MPVLAFWFHSVILRRCVIGTDIFKVKISARKRKLLSFSL